MSRHLLWGLASACLFACFQPTSTVELVVDPAQTDLGEISASRADEVEPLVVTLANVGTGPATLTELSLDSEFEEWFELSGVDLPLTLAAGDVVDVTLTVAQLPLDSTFDGTYFMGLQAVTEGPIASGCGGGLPVLDVEDITITFTLSQRCDADDDGDGVGPCDGDCDDLDPTVYEGA